MRAQDLVHQRQDHRASLRSELELVQRRESHGRAGGLRVRQQAQGLGELGVRERVQDVDVGPAVENRGKHLPLEQLPSALPSRLQEDPSQFAEHDLAQARLESGKHGRHVAEPAVEYQRIGVAFSVAFFDEPIQHRRQVGRVVDEDGQIGERDAVVRLGRIEPDPPAMWREEVDGPGVGCCPSSRRRRSCATRSRCAGADGATGSTSRRDVTWTMIASTPSSAISAATDRVRSADSLQRSRFRQNRVRSRAVHSRCTVRSATRARRSRRVNSCRMNAPSPTAWS